MIGGAQVYPPDCNKDEWVDGAVERRAYDSPSFMPSFGLQTVASKLTLYTAYGQSTLITPLSMRNCRLWCVRTTPWKAGMYLQN